MSPTRKPCALAVVIVATCDALCVCVIATPANAALLARFVGERKLSPLTVVSVKSFELARSPTCTHAPRPTQFSDVPAPFNTDWFVCR